MVASSALLQVIDSFITNIGKWITNPHLPIGDHSGWEMDTKCKAKLLPLCCSKGGPREADPLMHRLAEPLDTARAQ